MTVGEKNISIGKIFEGRHATLVPGAPNALFARIIEFVTSKAIFKVGVLSRVRVKGSVSL